MTTFADLTPPEFRMLAHALDLAEDAVLSEDGYSEVDQQALTALRRRVAAEEAGRG